MPIVKPKPPFPNIITGELVYGQLQTIESDKAAYGGNITFSIVTPAMVDEDKKYFAGSNPSYKLFLCEFTARLPSTQNRYDFQKLLQSLSGLQGDETWIVAMLHGLKAPPTKNAVLHGKLTYNHPDQTINLDVDLEVLPDIIPQEILDVYDLDKMRVPTNIAAQD